MTRVIMQDAHGPALAGTVGTRGWVPDKGRWEAFMEADPTARALMAGHGTGSSTPPTDEDRDWGFGPDVFDSLLDLYHLNMPSDGFELLMDHCQALLLGVGMWPGPARDGHGTVERLLDSDVPTGVTMDDVIGMVSTIIDDATMTGPVSGFLQTNDSRWFIGNLVSAEADGADRGTIKSAIRFACSGRSPMMLALLGCHDGYQAWGPVMRMRAALDPCGDPGNPDAADEDMAVNPAIMRDFRHLLGAAGVTVPQVKALAAMCRPALAGVSAMRHQHAAHPHPCVADTIAGMKAMHHTFTCGFGVPMGAISLLEDVKPGQDPDVNLALIDAEETLLRAGCHAYDTWGDCDLILTGRPLAEAITEQAGLPGGFVAETAMAATR